MSRRALRHEDAVLVLVLVAVAIPAAVALPMVWLGELDLKSRLTLTLAIGLVLARQIAEAHGGSLVVRSRAVGRGAEAVITLPAAAGEAP